MGNRNYKTYSLAATTSVKEQELTESTYARSCDYIQLRNTGSVSVKIVLITPEDRDADFDTEGKTITLVAGAALDDSLEVEKILYKTDSGSSTIEVYVSW
jgi:hypothetical protein